MIKTFIRKHTLGFQGGVKLVINRKTVWSESCGIIRLTKEDAQSDADWLKKVFSPVAKKAFDVSDTPSD